MSQLSKQGDKRAIEAVVDGLMFGVGLSEQGNGRTVAQFGPALVATKDVIDRMENLAGADPDAVLTGALVPGWDVSAATFSPQGSPQLMRARECLRGSNRFRVGARRTMRAGLRPPSRVFEFTAGWQFRGKRHFNAATAHVVEVDGRAWVIRNPRALESKPQPLTFDSVEGRILVLSTLALADQARWSVSFNAGTPLTVRVWCSPEGAQRIYSDRDRAPGKARRSALRAWVAEHWRELPSDPAQEYQVIEHLRGAQRFRWRGYDCVLRPSYNALSAAGLIKADKRATGSRRRRKRRTPCRN